MSKKLICHALFFFILFIFQNHQAESKLITDNLELTKEKILDNRPEIYFYNEFKDKGNTEKRNKSEIGGILGKEARSNYLKKLSESILKQKKPSENAKMLNYSFSNGWGARGMPFNVLYTPKTRKQRILKSVKPSKISPPDTTDKANSMKESTKQIPAVYDLVLENEKSLSKNPEQILKMHFRPRKYYSVIPQLFVSYGW